MRPGSLCLGASRSCAADVDFGSIVGGDLRPRPPWRALAKVLVEDEAAVLIELLTISGNDVGEAASSSASASAPAIDVSSCWAW